MNTPGLGESLLTDQEVKQLVEHDFATYYSENPAAEFAFQVWLNNAEVTAICLVMASPSSRYWSCSGSTSPISA